MKRATIALIRIYQRLTAVLVAQGTPLVAYSGCRSWPTCSQYSIDAIEREGVFKGLLQGTLRVAKCNPLFRPQ